MPIHIILAQRRSQDTSAETTGTSTGGSHGGWLFRIITAGKVVSLQFQENGILRPASFITMACQQGFGAVVPEVKFLLRIHFFGPGSGPLFQRFHKKGHSQVTEIFLDGVNRKSRDFGQFVCLSVFPPVWQSVLKRNRSRIF